MSLTLIVVPPEMKSSSYDSTVFLTRTDQNAGPHFVAWTWVPWACPTQSTSNITDNHQTLKQIKTGSLSPGEHYFNQTVIDRLIFPFSATAESLRALRCHPKLSQFGFHEVAMGRSRVRNVTQNDVMSSFCKNSLVLFCFVCDSLKRMKTVAVLRLCNRTKHLGNVRVHRLGFKIFDEHFCLGLRTKQNFMCCMQLHNLGFF